MNSGLRVLLAVGLAGVLLIVLLGPRWRGAFYRSWLRPRLLAFGILVAVYGVGLYLYRLLHAITTH